MLRSLTAVLALGAASTLVSADGIYAKNSPVLQVTARTYDSLIAQSNHTSIVEFYAPWCGHCQSLKPAYEKAAKSLAGLAKVAAINCDDEANKPLCGQMGIKGFPTLKIVKPGSKPGRPVVEDYQGARSAKAIVDMVVDKIPNHVKKVQDNELVHWLTKSSDAKAILFSDKDTTGALIKALAVDFLGSISFAQMRHKDKGSIKHFNVEKFPTMVLVPAGGQSPITYEGEMKKEAMVEFLSQVASPNPDPAPKKAKATSKPAKSKPNPTSSSAFSKASKDHKSADFEDYLHDAETVVIDVNNPTDSPLPIVEHNEKPLIIEDILPEVPTMDNFAALVTACLSPKTGTCILVLPPTQGSEVATKALASFAEVAEKHKKRHSNIFPFYSVPTVNAGAGMLRDLLSLSSEDNLEVVAINMKRKWWMSYTANEFNVLDVEGFVDAIRLGEGSKQKLPDGFFAQKDEEQAAKVTPEPEAVPSAETVAGEATSSPPDPEPAAKPVNHGEL